MDRKLYGFSFNETFLFMKRGANVITARYIMIDDYKTGQKI